MTARGRILIGWGLGAVWALALLIGAALFVRLPVFTLLPTIMTAFLAPGLVFGAMLIWHLWKDATSSTTPYSERHAAILRDSGYHLLLALTIWPGAAVLLGEAGPGVIVMLGCGLALSRVIFWVGAYYGPGLRAFGVSASILPTLLAAIWAVGVWLV